VDELAEKKVGENFQLYFPMYSVDLQPCLIGGYSEILDDTLQPCLLLNNSKFFHVVDIKNAENLQPFLP
jgi:hypothetical protein